MSGFDAYCSAHFTIVNHQIVFKINMISNSVFNILIKKTWFNSFAHRFTHVRRVEG